MLRARKGGMAALMLLALPGAPRAAADERVPAAAHSVAAVQDWTLPEDAVRRNPPGFPLSAQRDTEVHVAQDLPHDAPTVQRLRNTVVIGTGVVLVAAYGATQWYDEGFGGGFKTVHEGWFGRQTKYGGMDKLGHLGFSYASTRWFTMALKAAGNDDATARDLSAFSVLATMTAVEVLDGYSRRWRFSGEDALMNVVGVGLGWLLERHPAVDDVIDLRLRYQRSTQPDGTRTGFDPFSDYEGQTYLVVAKASGMPVLRDHAWSRYLELSVGYSARGFDPRTPDPRRYLNYGIGINVGALLEDFVLGNAGPVPKTVNRWFFEYFQLPGTQALGKKSF